MQVIIIRRGRVDFKWKTWSTSEQFNKDYRAERFVEMITKKGKA